MRDEEPFRQGHVLQPSAAPARPLRLVYRGEAVAGGVDGAPSCPPTRHSGGQIAGHQPKLLDQVRDAIRTRHYSYRTEEAYVGCGPAALRARGRGARVRTAVPAHASDQR